MDASTGNSVVILLTTCPSAEIGAEIAKKMVEARLAACVNIVPGARSIYRWKDEVCDDAEALLILKTAAMRRDEAMAALKAAHPYEVPEILVIKPEDGWPDYLKWVAEST
jgi:periplasmic divalent cation tolerance protein